MFLCRKGEVPVESKKLTVLDALLGRLNWSVRERNTGFTQVLVNLVIVFLRREKLSFLQNCAAINFTNLQKQVLDLVLVIVFFVVRNCLFCIIVQ